MSASSLCGAVALALIATLLPAPLLPDSVPPARAQNTSSSSSSTEGYQTETAETTRNPDGSYTTEIHSAPVQYEDSSGNWRNIDSTLVETNEDGFDYTNKANSFDVLLSEQSANDYMRVEVHGLAFDFRLEGAEGAAAEPRGSRLVYPDALDGVDLRDDADSQGVKETLVLHDSSAPSDYRFVMTPPPDQEVEAQENPDGSWAFFVDSMVEPVFVLETPTVYDSADSGEIGARAETHAGMDVTDLGDSFALDLSVDRPWLEDPARVFPVFLDPTITIQKSATETTEDASFEFNCATQVCTGSTGYRLPVGTEGGSKWRAALQFDLGGVPAGATITDANLRLLYDGSCISDSSSCGGVSHKLDLHRMTGAWKTDSQTSDLKWDKTAPLASYTLGSGAAAPKWLSWNVTPTVKSWLSGSTPNFGFLLKDSQEEPDKSGPRFPGKRYLAERSLRPALEVTWSSTGVTLLPPDVIHSDGAELNWTTESLGSQTGYEIHRSDDPGFAPSETTRLTVIRDAAVDFYRDTTAAPDRTFTYKVVSLSGNQVSNRQTVRTPLAGETTVTVQPDASSGRAANITYYSNPSDPTTVCNNFGASTGMRVGTSDTKRFRGLLHFDLRRIPSTATITSAALKVYHEATTADVGALEVHRVTRAWKEGTGTGTCSGNGATWNESHGGVNWSDPGADFNRSTIESSLPATTARDTLGWDKYEGLEGLVKRWVTGEAPNHGVLIKRSTDALSSTSVGKHFLYFADDYTIAPSLRPKLEVTYSDDTEPQAPSVSIGTPAAGAVVTTESLPLRAAAADDGKLTVRFFMDGDLIATQTSEPYATTWDRTTQGAHTLTVTATDDAGLSASKSVAFSVDKTTPQTGVGTVTDDPLKPGVKNVTASADVDVAKVEFYFDDTLFATDNAAPWTAAWDTLDPTQPAYDGTHAITTRAYRSNGVMGRSAVTSVTVDNFKGGADWKFEGDVTQDPTKLKPPKTVSKGPEAPASYAADIDIRNLSDQTWDKQDTEVWWRWLDPSGTVVSQGFGGSLPSNGVGKGVKTTIRAAVDPPPSPPPGSESARYQLGFELYDKTTGTFFSKKGVAPYNTAVTVKDHVSTDLGLERYYHYVGEPVGAGMSSVTNVATGNSLLRWTPFSSPGRGLATVLDLTYNSLEDHSKSPVGNNFSLAVSSLTRFGEPLDLHDNNGANAYVAFTDGDGTTHKFTTNGSGGWVEPPGVNLYLRKLAETGERTWAITRPDRVTFYYDDKGFPTSVVDRNNNTIKFTLQELEPGEKDEDPGGPDKRIVAITDADGTDSTPSPKRSYDVEYYSKEEAKKPQVRGQIKRITDHNGSGLSFDYYDDGNLLRITQEGGTKADGSFLPDRSFVFTYTDSNGDAAAILDPNLRSNPDPHTPNQSSRLFSVRDPMGRESTFAYYTSGQNKWKLKSWTNRAGQRTELTYDSDYQTTVKAPLSRVTRYVFDDKKRVTDITRDPASLNETTRLRWSTDNMVTRVTEPSGQFTEFSYNSNGYLTDSWDQLRNHTLLAYDNLKADAADPGFHISRLKTKTDARGNSWSFGPYDANDNLLKVTDPEGYFSTYDWGTQPNGNLQAATDPNGNVTHYSNYDANGFATTVTRVFPNAADNIVTTLSFDDDGLLQWVQDPNHQGDSGRLRDYVTRFDYDSFHRLGRTSTPKSTDYEQGVRIWSATDYDANDNVTKSYGPRYGDSFVRGAVTSVTYDLMDRPTTMVGPGNDSPKTSFTYDAAGRTKTTTAPNGNATPAVANDFVTTYDYDAFDRVTQTSRNSSANEVLITHNCYEALTGDLITTVPPKGHSAFLSCAAPGNFATKYSYDAAHRVKTVTDPEGHVQKADYDPMGNVISSTDADNVTHTRIYDKRGLVTKVIEPFSSDGTTTRNLTTSILYDAAGNQEAVISPRAWDAGSRSETDPYVTRYHYDAANRMTRVSLPSAGSLGPAYVHQAYDDNGNLSSTSLPVSVGDPSQVPAKAMTRMSYFDPGWVRTSNDSVNPEVHFDYSAEGWQQERIPETSMTDSQLNQDAGMTWSYYPDGMLKERDDQTGGTQTYTYDPNNNLVSAVDAAGVDAPSEKPIELSAAYDWLDRPTEVRNRKGVGGTNPFELTSYNYDLNSNVIKRIQDQTEGTAGSGRTSYFTYNRADWLELQEVYADKSDSCSDDLKVHNDYTNLGLEKERILKRGTGSPWRQVLELGQEADHDVGLLPQLQA